MGLLLREDLADPLMGDAQELSDVAHREASVPEQLRYLAPSPCRGSARFLSDRDGMVEFIQEFDYLVRRLHLHVYGPDFGLVDVEHHRYRLASGRLHPIEALGLREDPPQLRHGDRPPVTGADSFNPVALTRRTRAPRRAAFARGWFRRCTSRPHCRRVH